MFILNDEQKSYGTTSLAESMLELIEIQQLVGETMCEWMISEYNNSVLTESNSSIGFFRKVWQGAVKIWIRLRDAFLKFLDTLSKRLKGEHVPPTKEAPKDSKSEPTADNSKAQYSSNFSNKDTNKNHARVLHGVPGGEELFDTINDLLNVISNALSASIFVLSDPITSEQDRRFTESKHALFEFTEWKIMHKFPSNFNTILNKPPKMMDAKVIDRNLSSIKKAVKGLGDNAVKFRPKEDKKVDTYKNPINQLEADAARFITSEAPKILADLLKIIHQASSKIFFGDDADGSYF